MADSGLHQMVPRGDNLLQIVRVFLRAVINLRTQIPEVFIGRRMPVVPGTRKRTFDSQQNADVRADSSLNLFLETALKSLLPYGFTLWGEELGAKTQRGPFERQLDGLYVVYDGIDGTNNVNLGLPFTTAVSLVWKHSGTLTVLACLVFDHTGQAFWYATADSPTKMSNTTSSSIWPCQTIKDWNLADGVVFTTVSARLPTQGRLVRFTHKRLSGCARSIKAIGCSTFATAIICFPTGALALVHPDPKIEDAVAPLLLIARAGGIVGWEPDLPLIAAANQAVYDEVKHALLHGRKTPLAFPQLGFRLCFAI